MPARAAQFARPLLVLAALLAAPRARADEAADVKAVEAAGGKVQVLRLQTRTVYTVKLPGCATADAVLGKIDTIKEEIEFLNLERSGVTDAGLKAVAAFKALRFVDLSETAVTDAALEHLQKLPLLGQLELKRTKVSADGLKKLKDFPRVTSVSVSAPALTDAGLKNLAARKGLYSLWLSDGPDLTDAGFAALHGLPDLGGANFTNCPVTAKALEGFKGNVKLSGLSVAGTKLTAEHVAALKALTQVRSLDLSETGYVPTDAADWQHIHYLTIRGAKLTPETAKALGGLKELRSLSLRDSNLNDETVKELLGLKKLSTLDLTGTKLTNDGAMALKELNQVAWMYLSKTAVNSEGYKRLKPHLQNTHLFVDEK